MGGESNDFILRDIRDFQDQNFDIFTGYDNEPIISFHPPSTINEDGSVSQFYDFKTDDRGVEVLNGICQQVRDIS